MSNGLSELEALIQACMDGRASADESARLNARLRTDAAARDLYLQLADAHSCMAIDEKLWVVESPRNTTPQRRLAKPPSRWLQWRSCTAAVAGIVVGMLCATMVFAYVKPAAGRPRQIFSESFESGVMATKPGLPKEAGVWCGDVAEVVAANKQMPAKSGSKMLRFVSASYPGANSKHAVWGDVYQLVDVRGMVHGDSAMARLTAHFAQAEPSSCEVYRCSVAVIALDDMPSANTLTEIRNAGSASSTCTKVLPADSQWHDLATDVAVSRQTRFLFVHLAVFLKSPELSDGVLQFRAHYLDDVTIDLHHPAQR